MRASAHLHLDGTRCIARLFMASPKTKPADLLDCLAAAPALADRLHVLGSGKGRMAFEHVHEAAQPTVAALIARNAKRRIWFVCPTLRTQEDFHNGLLHWFPDAQFFPELETSAVEGSVADPETVAERLAILEKLTRPDSKASETREIIVLTLASLDDSVPSARAFARMERRLEIREKRDQGEVIKELATAGYERVSQVSMRGQFALRGGILDVFSFHHLLPVRIEWFDDEIESIRQFDPDAQTSVEHLEFCTLLLGETEGGATIPLKEYIGPKDLVVDCGAETPDAQAGIYTGTAPLPDEEAASPEDYTTAFFDHGLGEFEAGDFVIDEGKRERFFDQLKEWREAGWTTFVFCNNEGEVERLYELIPAVEADALRFELGNFTRGFIFPAAKVAVLCDAQLFGRYRNNRARLLTARRTREAARRSPLDFSNLIEGELVVHLEHGIGRYEEMRLIERGDGSREEVLVVEFAEKAKLYVPLEQSFLLSHYVGVGKRNPLLSRLGGDAWAKAKKSAEKAVFDYAARLLETHAQRETQLGYAFPPDNKWMREFESSFLYKETPDQLTAIQAAKEDMEDDRPMDRLICGDVGFGKTEVAIRAAFKSATSGKQVAILVPTTVLAEQHYRNFRERMSDYPVRVEMLSRFRTRREQNETVRGLADGSVDIVIGTHRLISKDVCFKDLGLVVIDEEQRFGVLHKEKLKAQFPLVDLLTLSATPIPRTLYLSLMGAKDMSTIETAPPNRVPVETMICPYDERIIRDAINRELKRQGQVYFLHNRVGDIANVEARIKKLCPQARTIVGHGQMEEGELEEVMHTFVKGDADVLISTTIIESGVDIPNANTIIIDRADRFGLADLYQLRGRVGRAQHKAFAYLMLPRDMMAAGEARKRINAIKQYGSLGAGFKIAMRDLEIRGAGNILGTAQSGHIVTVGFDLYCSLLKQAISKLKGEQVRSRLDVSLSFDCVLLREAEFIGKGKNSGYAPAFVPQDYIGDSSSRIAAYRELNQITVPEQLEALRKSWRDRYGPFPPAVENLLLLTGIKLSAVARKITAIEVKENKLMLTRNKDFVLIGGKFPRLNAKTPEAQIKETLAMIRSL